MFTDVLQISLIAFDFQNQQVRDAYVDELYKQGFLCNPTRDKSIRLRPNLAVSEDEINDACNIFMDTSSLISKSLMI